VRHDSGGNALRLSAPRGYYSPLDFIQGHSQMPPELSDEALDFLIARAGLALTSAQKAELKSVYAGIAQMAERVRKPRGRMAEPAHIYDFAEEDLS
jgi:hypothetical protein